MNQNNQAPEGMEAPFFWGFNDCGQQVKCDILVTFDVEYEGRNVHVVVYTDNAATPEGDLKIYAAQYPDGVFLPNMKAPELEDLPDMPFLWHMDRMLRIFDKEEFAELFLEVEHDWRPVLK